MHTRAATGGEWACNEAGDKGAGDGDGDSNDAGGGAHSLSKADAIRFAQC